MNGDGSADITVFLVEADANRRGYAAAHAQPEALEGFIYALAAQHGVAADAFDQGRKGRYGAVRESSAPRA
jgi:hypothetical protein